MSGGPDPLSLDEVADLLASLEQQAGGDDRSERRRHPRTAAAGHVPATVRRSGSGVQRVSVRDLSRSGVGIWAQVPIEVGERVEVSVEPPGRGVMRATCRVVSCRLEADGRYVVGLEFVEIARQRAAAAAGPVKQAGPATQAQQQQQAFTADPGAGAAHADEVAARLEKLLSS